MALGLIDNCKRIVLNTKCIVFSFLMAAIYWNFTPSAQNNALLLLAFLALVQWYKLYYSCANITWKTSIIVTLAFWSFFIAAPKKNPYILAFVLYFSYLLQSWFDYFMKCELGKLEPTILPFGRYIYLPFKDPEYKAKYEAMCQEKKALMDKVDMITAIIIAGLVFTVFVGKMLSR